MQKRLSRFLIISSVILGLSLQHVNCKTCKITSDCKDPTLACDLNKGTCLKVFNGSCSQAADCVNDLICTNKKCQCRVN